MKWRVVYPFEISSRLIKERNTLKNSNGYATQKESMKSFIVGLIGLVFVVAASAEPLLEGRASGARWMGLINQAYSHVSPSYLFHPRLGPSGTEAYRTHSAALLRWHAEYGQYVCSDFQPSALAILDVTAGVAATRPVQIRSFVNSGRVETWPNGHATTNCHVPLFERANGDVQHNLGFWPETPPSVLNAAGDVR